jgi:hypothetical protein
MDWFFPPYVGGGGARAENFESDYQNLRFYIIKLKSY